MINIFLAFPLLLFITLNSAASANQIKLKTDFLNSVKEEIQEKSANDKRFEKQAKELLKCVALAQNGLDLIAKEFKKTKRSKEALNELMEDFNKKMKDLRDKYKFLMLSKQELGGFREENPNNVAAVSSINSLNLTSKKRPLKKDKDFKGMEFIEIPGEKLLRVKKQESVSDNKIFSLER